MHRSIVEVNKIARRATKLLRSHIRLKAGYLFGSYVNGKPHKYSDIDLAFFSPSVERMGLEKKISLRDCFVLPAEGRRPRNDEESERENRTVPYFSRGEG